MYYPLSQITTGLYSDGELVFKNNTNNFYTGPYWKNSKGKFYTGTTPQDTPVFELIEFSSSPLYTPNNRPDVVYYNSDILFDRNIEPENESISINDNGLSIDISEYLNIKKIDSNSKTTLPIYILTIPTDKDYQIGEFRRYFCKKINEIIYIEIDKEQYDLLTNKNPKIAYVYYQPFNIPWKISNIDKNNIAIINSNIVKLTMFKQKLPMFDMYLKEDYTKYYK
tara:strand:+ start:6310 stop:6981 length:672 start_codon:yes stop_codon:yes gene_type:complete